MSRASTAATSPIIDYTQLFLHNPEPSVVIACDDPAFTIIAQNDAHAALTSTSQADVVGRSIFETFPDTSEKFKTTGVSDLRESFRAVIRTKRPDSMDALRYDIKGKDGAMTERYWRATHYPLFDAGGAVTSIRQITNDVTEEMHTANRLEYAEDTLAAALEIGQVGSWAWDIQKNVVIADRNLSKLFGLDAATGAAGLPLETFIDSIYESDRKRVQAAIETAIKQKSAFEAEYRTITSEGELRWVIARGRIELDASGQPASFPGVIVDISERKQIELSLHLLAGVSQNLTESINRQAMLDSVAATIVKAGMADWCAIDMLDAAEEPHTEAAAHSDPAKRDSIMNLRQHIPASRDRSSSLSGALYLGKAALIPRMEEAMLTSRAKTPADLNMLHQLSIRSAIVVPIRNQTDRGALTIISSDPKRMYGPQEQGIAEEIARRLALALANSTLLETTQQELVLRQKLEEDLRQSNDKLEARVRSRTRQLERLNEHLTRSNKELEDFAYVASHDLQEPLRKIQAFANLLQDEYGNALGDGRDYLERMRGAASRMSSLIEDLLSFSRVTTKARPFSQIDLTEVVTGVLGDLETRITETHALVDIDALPVIYGDPTQMRQLFQNLIGNALKFSRPGVPPVVTISCSVTTAKDGTIKEHVLRVRDNGIGFDEKYLDRIFAVFQRLHGRSEYEGTGIGLAICRKIAERHHGSITARSRQGEGAEFIITLPAKRFKEPTADGGR